MLNALSYESVSLVNIRNWKLGLVYRFCQLAILGYVIGYSLVYRKAYQAIDEALGTADMKVKGSAYTNASNGLIVYDALDLVYPATERDAIFVTTNMWTTSNQQRGTCADVTDASNACPCVRGKSVRQGVQTGKCLTVPLPVCANPADVNNQTIVPSRPTAVSYCELNAWCPIEYQPDGCNNELSSVSDLTVLVRVNARFPNFNVRINNAKGNLTRGVNLFDLNDMVTASGHTFDAVSERGAIIVMNANFDCNLDWHGESSCAPDITFTRIDDPTSSFSYGYNFRTPMYWSRTERDVVKRNGIRLVTLVSGRAGRFSLIPLFLSLGAGLGLLSVATVVADAIAFHLLGTRSSYYRTHKYRDVEDRVDDVHAGDASRSGGGSGSGSEPFQRFPSPSSSSSSSVNSVHSSSRSPSAPPVTAPSSFT